MCDCIKYKIMYSRTYFAVKKKKVKQITYLFTSHYYYLLSPTPRSTHPPTNHTAADQTAEALSTRLSEQETDAGRVGSGRSEQDVMRD